MSLFFFFSNQTHIATIRHTDKRISPAPMRDAGSRYFLNPFTVLRRTYVDATLHASLTISSAVMPPARSASSLNMKIASSNNLLSGDLTTTTLLVTPFTISAHRSSLFCHVLLLLPCFSAAIRFFSLGTRQNQTKVR